MIEVFVLGVFVAYVKLGDLVTIEMGIGVYALLALTVVFVWADGALDREAVWDAVDGAAPGMCHGGHLSRDACQLGPLDAKPARLLSCPGSRLRTARAAAPRCMPVNRIASRGPGPW